MDIQNLSVDMAQTRVQEEAAVRVQAMMMQNISDAAENLDKLMESAQPITDPSKGNLLDLLG